MLAAVALDEVSVQDYLSELNWRFGENPAWWERRTETTGSELADQSASVEVVHTSEVLHTGR